MDIVLLTIIILATITLLVTQWLRIELTALLIVVSLPATGILAPSEALSGFASEATMTIAAMFILSAGLI
ncbi:MAG: SLC13/DASS family transporter, partial [Candidatus Krumholzibacteria bacterium]|nr:SLC13/DASS family transporter [Candidatus Krumholzibacteria bacterium]